MSKTKIVLFIVFWVVFITGTIWAWQMLKSPNILVDAKDKKVLIIPTGSDFKAVIEKLKAGDMVGDMVSFAFLAKVLRYSEKVMPGRYVLRPRMSNIELLRKLRSGSQDPLTISFHNVRIPQDLAERITQQIEMTPEEFLVAFNDQSVQKEYGFNQDNFVCAFIPNTYEVYYTVKPKKLIKRMLSEYKKFWTAKRLKKAKEIGLNPKEVCVMASIVSAETIKKDEYKKVAGLYYNRFKKGMLLQADPTVVFALKDFSIRRVTNKQIAFDSPYNTYKYVGLPPGPIYCPEPDIVDAVLFHDKHNYLFMCAKEDFSGYHNFAETHTLHLINARKYQAALTKRKIFH